MRTTVDEKAFGNALLTEMTHMASLLPEHPSLSSLFFGGGTPSLMPPWLVEQLINHAQNLFGFASDIEITAEANPTSIEPNQCLNSAKQVSTVYRWVCNHLMMPDLKFLGREHSVKDALAALDTVRNCL